jgi:hypothetical protein
MSMPLRQLSISQICSLIFVKNVEGPTLSDRPFKSSEAFTSYYFRQASSHGSKLTEFRLYFLAGFFFTFFRVQV